MDRDLDRRVVRVAIVADVLHGLGELDEVVGGPQRASRESLVAQGQDAGHPVRGVAATGSDATARPVQCPK